jgi:hypothetical protein
MTHDEIVNRAGAELVQYGVGKQTAAPGHYQLCWWLGLHLHPPHFQSFLSLVVFNALFTVLAFVAVAIAQLPFGFRPEMASAYAPYACGVALMSGAGMAVIYRASALWLELPSWADYAADADYDAEW